VSGIFQTPLKRVRYSREPESAGVVPSISKKFSDTLENNGMEFLLGRAKSGISRLLSHNFGNAFFSLRRLPRE
jgi:hypothetical protein